jgi:protein phosphatase 1D
MYVAHVGDSGVVLGSLENKVIKAEPLTSDHKPETPDEKRRIEGIGGKVLVRNGVHRVAWERPVFLKHRGPITRRTKTELVPFLAVSRALGKQDIDTSAPG